VCEKLRQAVRKERRHAESNQTGPVVKDEVSRSLTYHLHGRFVGSSRLKQARARSPMAARTSRPACRLSKRYG
jgi:hypothetical protein